MVRICIDDCEYDGIDTRDKFVKICKDSGRNAKLGNCLNIPLETNKYDATICIAVLHHLSQLEDRKRCVNEIIRITKPKGKILIQVWEFNKDKHSCQDEMIQWTSQKKFTNHKMK